MRKERFLFIIFTFFLFAGKLWPQDEQVLRIGGEAGWASVQSRNSVAETSLVRPFPVMALSSARTADDPRLDIALCFDEENPLLFSDMTGHYAVRVSPSVSSADRNWARYGSGAAVFSGGDQFSNQAGNGPLVITPAGAEALLFSGQSFKDFSVEFWLYPMNMENGEQVLSWTSTRRTMQGESTFQRIQCLANRNRLRWTFLDFFAAPDDAHQLTLTVTSITPVLPRTWSHHLIRFDSGTGMLEYLINGRTEGLVYATSSGREGGDVYSPVIGQGGELVLGGRFTGMMDEFRAYGAYIENPFLYRYPAGGGRFETIPLDTRSSNTAILKVEASGGRIFGDGRNIVNEYTGDRAYAFSDAAAVSFYIRASDNPYQWDPMDDTDWLPFTPGTELPGTVRGRFVQIAAQLYPSGDGESTPYLDELRIIYRPDAPPPPPARLTALAREGGVELSWSPSSDEDVGGYLVYYGTSKGEYFGDSAILGVSPVNVGKRTSIFIDGLQGGTLYYFAVAAYDRVNPPHIGEFSREVTARPLRKNE
ncbi:hypothetical protein LJC14_00290 [Treponema sp. OttesenSCG-928-L16]|nr:hypothetical protein [Treponema sp. OttesenSCG-928-L16]